jgi:hypothetical protein
MPADRGNRDHDYVIDVPANPTINMLRTTQQHHVQLSAMADIKANIVITASSVLLTLSIQAVDNETVRASLITLSLFMLGALVFSVLAVLPKFRSEPMEPHRGRPYNLLFFGDFARLDEDTYRKEMMKVIEQGPDAVFEAQLNDIYQLGSYLQHQKYRYLRWSYLFFLLGVVTAAVIQMVITVF